MAFPSLTHGLSWLRGILACTVCMAAHSAWVPLDQEIVNRSEQTWTLEFVGAPNPRLGYALTAGTSHPEAAVCPAKVPIAPRQRLVFYVDPSALEQGLANRVQIREQHATKALFQCNLEVDRLTGLSRYGLATREYGTACSTFVLMAPHAISIVPAGFEPKALDGGERKDAGTAGTEALPALTEVDAEAGATNTFHYYTAARIARDATFHPYGTEPGITFAALHRAGHLMPPELLADYFFNTLFQYNIRKFMNYDPNLNYDQYPTLQLPYFSSLYTTWLDRFCTPRGVRILATPAPGGDFSEFNTWKASFEKAMVAFQRNPAFVSLGTAYMRQKIVTEKLHAVLLKSGKGAKEDAFRILMAHDRLVTDYQAMIYHWMDRSLAEYLRRYQRATPEGKLEAGAFLEAYHPDFLAIPRYRDLLEAAPKHMEPASRVEGLDLPAA